MTFGVTRLSHVRIVSRFPRFLSTRNRLIEIEIETGLLYLIFSISFIACRTCSPCIARISRSKPASQCWREKLEKKRKIGSCLLLLETPTRYWQASEGVWLACRTLQCRRFLRARKCFYSWKLHDGSYNNTKTNKVSPTHRCFSGSLTSCRAPLSERLERAMSTRTKRSGSAQESLWLLVC